MISKQLQNRIQTWQRFWNTRRPCQDVCDQTGQERRADISHTQITHRLDKCIKNYSL